MAALFNFVAGAAIGGLLSWLITHRYYIKAGKEQKRQFLALSEKLKPKNSLRDFEQYLEGSAWEQELIDGTEVWIAESDSTFQIVHGERSRDFRERWTEVYPDTTSAAYPIYLKIGGNVIKELTFISMDGGRILVALPEIRPVGNDAVEYFWNMNSLEVKVCKIIGTYYIYGDIRGIAKRSKIALVE